MKKTLAMLLSALAVAGMATAASAFEENADYISYGEITAANYPASHSEGWPTCTTGQLLKGKIIAGVVGEQVARDGHTADLAFDGDPSTYYGSFEHSTRSYVGIVLDQAYQLTEIRARIADDVPTDNFHGLSVQGSNDGIHWEDIIDFRQDATGKTYHIFTPQTVTEQSYIDNGYGTRTDESPFWVGSGNSYSIYRVWTHACDLSLAEIEFYGNPAPATVLDDEAAAALIATTTWFPGNINVRNVTIESIDGSLVGKVVGAAGSWNKAFYENAFDGNNKKAYDPSFRGPENWVGLWLDEPHALKSFKVMPKRGAYANLEGCLIQGSMDGRTWVTLCQLTAEDVPTKQEWITKEVNGTEGYLYFRYVTNIRSHGDIADILFFGEPAAAAANIPAAEKYPVATYEKFLGTMVDTGITSTSVDGSITGTIMGFGDIWFLDKDGEDGLALAFDGDLATSVGFEKLGPGYFVGLKLDAPTVITEAKLYPEASNGLKIVSGAHLQGSVDGINWVDLAVFTDADIPAAQEWVGKAVTDTTAYNYVRYAPSTYSGTAMCEVAFIGTAAAETPAETAAPAVDTPATDTPVAPQTFDAGVIAAVAAVVSAAGYAITKKRK